MRQLKKRLSLFLAFALCVTFFYGVHIPIVSAASADDDPNVAYTQGAIEATATDSAADGTLDANIMVTNGESYTFSYWFRGSSAGNSNNLQAVVWGGPGGFYTFQDTPLDNTKWQKAVLNFTATADETVNLNVRFMKGVTDVYFYGMSFVRNSDNTELLANNYSDFKVNGSGFTSKALSAVEIEALFPASGGPSPSTSPSPSPSPTPSTTPPAAAGSLDPNVEFTEGGLNLVVAAGSSTSIDSVGGIAVKADTYTFSFWVRGNGSTQAVVWSQAGYGGFYNYSSVTSTVAAWTHVSLPFTVGVDGACELTARFIDGPADLTFYGMSLIRGSDGAELLNANSGYSNFKASTTTGVTTTVLTATDLATKYPIGDDGNLYAPYVASDPNAGITQGGARLYNEDPLGECGFTLGSAYVQKNETYKFCFWYTGYTGGGNQMVVWGGPMGFYNWASVGSSPDDWRYFELEFTAANDETVDCAARWVKGLTDVIIYNPALVRVRDNKQLIIGGYTNAKLEYDNNKSFTLTQLDPTALTYAIQHKPVSGITGVPIMTTVGETTLNPVVAPDTAANKTIVWSIKDAGTTGATMNGNVLTATAEGTLVLHAVIVDGLRVGKDFVADYTIDIVSPDVMNPKIPSISKAPYNLLPGDVASVSGGYFGPLDKIKVAIQPLSSFTGDLATFNPDNADFVFGAFQTDVSLLQFEIPQSVPKDVWALWVGNDNGWSNYTLINKAEPYWVTDRTVYPGQKLTLGGRNFVNPTNRSADNAKVTFHSVDSSAVYDANIYDLTDYTVHFTAPANLPVGQYDITYTNGAGGSYGVAYCDDAARERVTAIAKNANIQYFDDNFDANAAWLGQIPTGPSNTFNIKDYGAVGDGVANDSAAIDAAVAAVTANGGGILYIPEGVYLFDGIKLPYTLCIAVVGDGQDKSVLKWRTRSTGATGAMIQANSHVVGIFNLKLENDFLRPGNVNCIDFYGWNADGNGAPDGGDMMKNVTAITADGRGVYVSQDKSVVIDNCDVESLNGSFHAAPAGRIRITNSIMKNCNGANIAFSDNLNAGLDMGQAYFDNNRIIGDSLNRRALDNHPTITDEMKTWGEILMDQTEHRPADIMGNEMLLVNNSIEGVYGDPASNAGEGWASQCISAAGFYGYALSGSYDRIATGKPTKAMTQIPGESYVTIIGGPGAGQIRKIVGVDGDVLIVDKPWDVIPTSESMYTVDNYNMMGDIYCNNDISAKTLKGSFSLYCTTYDMTIAGNRIAGGAGIWMAANLSDWGGMSYVFTQYFMNIYNNHIDGAWGEPWFLSAQNTIIGPCGDGGASVGMNNSVPGSLVYAMRYVHNTFEGPNDVLDGIKGNNLYVNYTVTPDGRYLATDGTMPQPPAIPQYLWDASVTLQNQGKPWWLWQGNSSTGFLMNQAEQITDYKKFAMLSGLFISQASSNPYPVANGTVVDGNYVTNTMYGLRMSNTSYNTVLRNNDFTDNKYNLDISGQGGGIDTTTTLDTARGEPGMDNLGKINKSALGLSPDIDVSCITLDKASMNIVIGDTQTLTADVQPFNATNKNVVWTSSHISIATVKDGVVTAVNPGKAIITVTTRDGAHKATCMVTISANTPVDRSALSAAITAANTDIASVSVSADGKDITVGTTWVTQASIDTYQAAIDTANIVLADSNTTQIDIDSAVTALANATTTFNAAKSIVPALVTTALSTTITAANTNIASISVSTDGSDVTSTQDWVTQAVLTAYQNAINAAKAVLNNATTQTAVENAVSDLASATTTFNNAKAKGTKGTIVVVSVTTRNGASDVNFAITSANGKGYSVYLSTSKNGPFTLYSDVNYNIKGIHIKGLKNGGTFYMYIEYKDGKGNISRSSIIKLSK